MNVLKTFLAITYISLVVFAWLTIALTPVAVIQFGLYEGALLFVVSAGFLSVCTNWPSPERQEHPLIQKYKGCAGSGIRMSADEIQEARRLDMIDHRGGQMYFMGARVG